MKPFSSVRRPFGLRGARLEGLEKHRQESTNLRDGDDQEVSDSATASLS
jgi:hypothetical protein